MSDELSDLAAKQFCESVCAECMDPQIALIVGCREWRRRAEALIEQERVVRIRVEQMYQALTESIETERRKTFFYVAKRLGKLPLPDEQLEQAYRAYTEAAKEEK